MVPVAITWGESVSVRSAIKTLFIRQFTSFTDPFHLNKKSKLDKFYLFRVYNYNYNCYINAGVLRLKVV